MPRNLLVVDDSPTIGEAVRCALTGEEWAVTAVATRAQALEAIRRNLPDVVLCDVALGEEDGYQVCRALRAEAAGAALPIVLMGGTVSENLASGAGAVAVLAKPFQSDELLDVLQTTLEQAPLAAGEEEFLSLEPAPSAGPGAETLPAGVAGVDEVEIIDLSEGDDLPDVEFLDDLEPLPAPLRDTKIDEGQRLPLSAGELDFGPLGDEEKPEAIAARSLGRDEIGGAGPVEFDLSDFETEPEPVRNLGAPRSAAEAPLLPELELLPLEEPDTPGAPYLEPEPGELLEDIDLEGWAEEDLPAAREGAPPFPGLAPEPAARPEAPPQAGAFEFGLEDLEPLALEAGEAPGEALASASGTFELREEMQESWGEEPDAGRAGEAEQPPPLFAPELGQYAAAGVFAPEPAGAEPSGEGAPAPLWSEEPEDDWESSELLELAEPPGVADAGAYGGAAPGWALEGLSLEEPAAGPVEPLELLGETPARQDEREIWGAEPSGPSAIPCSEEPFPAPAEERAEGEAWAEPPPTPPSGLPWDRSALEPEPLATQVAAGAGEAVRRALLESLSPDKLTPLVAATVERVVWEVVPQLAERLIREAIEKLQSEPPDET